MAVRNFLIINHDSHPAAGWPSWLVLLCAGLLTLLSGGQLSSAQAQTAPLEIKISFADQTTIPPDEPMVLQLSRALNAEEGRLAVFFGTTDVTDLFTATDNDLSYGHAMPLPSGQMAVIVYLVSPDNHWQELAQFPIQVIEPNTGSIMAEKKLTLTPTLNLSLKSQLGDNPGGSTNSPDSATLSGLTVQAGIEMKANLGAYALHSQFNFIGVSNINEALRFREQGARAARFDLSSYLLRLQKQRGQFSFGHITYGSNRHLINNFASRGITASAPLGTRSDISFSLMNGSAIAGFNNFFGLNNRSHQILSATLGTELVPQRPGALRVELGMLNGQLLPLSNFNQGNINDAEQSRGLGVRVVALLLSERLRLDSGYSVSRFSNPADPLLNQGNNIVPVRETTRRARYLDLSYDLVRTSTLNENRKATLTLSYQHEKVDPLYRSVAATTQADQQRDQFGLSGGIGAFTAQYLHLRSQDNLADIPSILKTLTRQNTLTVNVPLLSIIKFSYTFDRTHQFGDALPINGGFEVNPATIPDQISTNQSLMAEWQGERWRFSYRFNRSFQDNRQPGRAQADLKNIIHGATLAFAPRSTINFDLDLSAESAHNNEQPRTDRTWRVSLITNWQITAKSSLMANLSTTLAGDSTRASKNRNSEMALEWSRQFEFNSWRFKKGQIFLRYNRRSMSARDDLFGINNRTSFWTINSGASFTLF